MLYPGRKQHESPDLNSGRGKRRMGGVGKGGTAEYLLQLVMHRPYFGTPHHLIPYFSTLFFYSIFELYFVATNE